MDRPVYWGLVELCSLKLHFLFSVFDSIFQKKGIRDLLLFLCLTFPLLEPEINLKRVGAL